MPAEDTPQPASRQAEASGSQPAAGPVRAADAYAWALALVPLAEAVLWGPLVVAGWPGVVLHAAATAASAALVLADKRALAASDPSATGQLPATAWFLLPFVYLWQRGVALRRSRAPAWAWVAAVVVAFPAAVMSAGLAAHATGDAGRPAAPATGDELPDCSARDAAEDVLRTFNKVPQFARAGLRGVALEDQEEVGQGPGRRPTVRYCTGTVLGSDTRDYDVRYAFELRGGHVVIRLEVR